MAEQSLIAAYLTELRYSVASLRDADDIVDEAADHLLTAVEALTAAGLAPAEAEALALARYGSAALVSGAFVEESRRGAAVSTALTRKAGLAAMAAPVLAVIGQAGNEGIDRGPGHGAAVVVLGAAFAAFVLALWGLRKRHGGLGGLGKAAFWLFVLSPVVSAPFTWAAPVVAGALWLVVATLLGIGMVRARILPAPAVALFAFSPAATLAGSILLTAAGVRAAVFVPFGFLAFAVGLTWVGWALWREPALDARPTAGPLPA